MDNSEKKSQNPETKTLQAIGKNDGKKYVLEQEFSLLQANTENAQPIMVRYSSTSDGKIILSDVEDDSNTFFIEVNSSAASGTSILTWAALVFSFLSIIYIVWDKFFSNSSDNLDEEEL